MVQAALDSHLIHNWFTKANGRLNGLIKMWCGSKVYSLNIMRMRIMKLTDSNNWPSRIFSAGLIRDKLC